MLQIHGHDLIILFLSYQIDLISFGQILWTSHSLETWSCGYDLICLFCQVVVTLFFFFLRDATRKKIVIYWCRRWKLKRPEAPNPDWTLKLSMACSVRNKFKKKKIIICPDDWRSTYSTWWHDVQGFAILFNYYCITNYYSLVGHGVEHDTRNGPSRLVVWFVQRISRILHIFIVTVL